MGDCAEAFKVDGFDDQLCLSQRHSCSFAYVAILVVPVLFVRTWDARIGAVLATIPDQHCRVVSALRVLIFN